MTWGKLRLQLQTAAAGVSLDLIDEFLNARYETVLGSTDWTGINAHATIATQAAYQSGTDSVTLTVGSPAVAGSGTAWTSALIGQRFYRPGDSVYYTVTAVPAAGSLTLDRPYEGNGVDATGTIYTVAPYVFMQHIYALPADCGTVVSILDPVSALPMDEMSKPELDASAACRTLLGDPKIWALWDDSVETSPPVLHQVEFYPPPLVARGFPLEYRRAALGFDGDNTSAGPLPFVTDSVLLFGCRADIAAYLATEDQKSASAHLAKATLYERKFQDELARLLRIEHQQRRKKTSMKMADRFTRHRLARATHGANQWRGGTPGGSD